MRLMKQKARLSVVLMVLCVGCRQKENRNAQPAPLKRYASAMDLIGMRFGGELPRDSGLLDLEGTISKNRSGQEFGLAAWRVCASGPKLAGCQQILEFVAVDSQVNENNLRVIVEAKSPPGPGLVPAVCQDRNGMNLLAWQDISDLSNKKVVSAWRVQDYAVKLEVFPPDSVLCDVNEDEVEGKYEDEDAPVPAPLFDNRGETRIGDVNGDGLYDTITAVHGNSLQAIRSIFSQVIPDSSLRESGDTNSNWGLTIRLGTDVAPKRSDSLYLPEISSVIYDQGGPDLVRLDTLGYFDLRAAASGKGQCAVSLFTQSGNLAYLYYLKGKYRVYWPEVEPE